VRGILVPREVETSSLELLRRTVEAADERKLPMATHAAYSVLEFHETVRQYTMTPIELLHSLGMLRPTLNIGHGNFIADNPNLNYSRACDLRLMGEARVSISHCPINIVRRARVLDNWKRYREAGVNISIGSDTYPRDMIMNMRTASYLGKIMSHTYLAATAGEVFEAATLGGAISVGRDDLGRLTPGAAADIIIVDLSGRDTLRYGPVRDPVKSLVECGIGDDIETVIVDGRVVVQGGKIPGVDFADLRKQAQAAGEAIWATLPEWDPLGRTADDACPWCYPLGV
jgi:cytosine/adenosine deaminase-related metal-dependent hydrolase